MQSGSAPTLKLHLVWSDVVSNIYFLWIPPQLLSTLPRKLLFLRNENQTVKTLLGVISQSRQHPSPVRNCEDRCLDWTSSCELMDKISIVLSLILSLAWANAYFMWKMSLMEGEKKKNLLGLQILKSIVVKLSVLTYRMYSPVIKITVSQNKLYPLGAYPFFLGERLSKCNNPLKLC